MTGRKLLTLSVVLTVVVGLLVTGGVPPAQSQAKAVRLTMVLGRLDNPFFASVRDGAQAEANRVGNVQVTVLGSSSIEDQLKKVEDSLQTKPDVLGVSAWDRNGIVPAIQKANAAKIPVIMIDEGTAAGQTVAFISTDNVEGGRLAGTWIVQAMGGKGKLAIIEGAPGGTTNNDRLKGLHEVIDKAPGIKVVASVPADWVRDKGLKVMGDILVGNPDLDAVMAMNDEMALGAMQAIKARGKLGRIKLVGYNGAAEAIQEVYRGNMAADIVQFPEEMGRLFVVWALNSMKGVKPPVYHIAPPVISVDTVTAKKIGAAILAIK
ncbi:MAG TPA: sugar ABC transporter substrate-binding protein [bacterium]|nr:sugar ABC transporter substrate-binding protein [bacterium]